MSSAKLDINASIATITFNRDEKRNAFNEEMSREVLSHIITAEEKKCRVIILRANPGATVWCSGHDLTELKPGEDPTQSDDPMVGLIKKIQETPIPVIAMVEGNVYAGGLLLNMVADIAIASKNAEVAMTANRLGIPFSPETYAYCLRVMGLHKAKELFFTASNISAQDAYNVGIFNHTVDNRELERFTAVIAKKIIACSPKGVGNSKLQLNLIASRSSLTEEDLCAIKKSREELVESPEFKKRLNALIESIHGGQ